MDSELKNKVIDTLTDLVNERNKNLLSFSTILLVLTFLINGEQIKAIKLIREETSTGLKESKMFTDEIKSLIDS